MTAVAAGIVAFNPDHRMTQLCADLIAQGCAVFVQDNASTSGVHVLTECESLGARVTRGSQNAGVAGALARLLAQTSADFDWLVTFDQDSQISAGFIGALTTSSATASSRVAVVAPRVVETATSTTVQGNSDDRLPRRLQRVITSGALCRVTALNEVGGFREGLFIDYVDFDLCLRLASAGWQLMLEPQAVLRHSIGAQSVHRLFGLLPITTSNHSPDRQYYKFRNYLLLLRDRTLLTDPKSAILDGLALLWAPVKIALFESQKSSKLRAIGHGVADGLRGRSGRRPDSRS